MRSIESIAGASRERAGDRGATLRRLLSELGPHGGELALAFVLIVIGAGAQAGGPYLIGRAIDRNILGDDPSGLFRTMILLLVVYAAGTLAQSGQIRQVGAVGQRILASLRARIFDKLQHLPLSYFDRRPVGDVMSRTTNDVDTLNQFLSQGVTQLLGSLFSLLGIVVAMLFLDLRLALVCFTIIPAMLLTTSFFARRARRAFRQTRETVGDVTAGLQEEIVGVREAQAFNRVEANIARFRERNAANRTANVQAVAVTSAFAPAIDVLSTLAIALVIGYGGYLVYAGGLTVGLLAAFLIYVQQFFRPLQLASQVYTQAQAALAGAERIYEILDEEPEPADPPGTPELGRVEGRITFEDVSFAYEPKRPVLDGVSFDVAPGQTVALVGATGAGKTTIANLIPRFYDVTGGAVRIYGHDVREVTRRSVRRNVATVLQEPFLFSGTISENISYGRAGDEKPPTREETERAARVAQADGFIRDLPEGYETRLGEAGGSLSQGQRQLLSFARAVLADPAILILDEATSNIDTRTEAVVQGALKELLTGRTSVVIAHRLSTIRDADRILVVENGRIAESGTHAELLAAGGLYADLYRRQFRESAPVAEG
ncbi:ATP-binding cassette domain-containing protein [Rubrobacter marinus]|uniref:Fatty acid ABC transporter ATP-binding/permease protein n=1 Tax=Rubrobacter marinus TaxID=2653852 RepID=A0A6G8PYJ3_9ACTN|nr:ABC transporter ATP-binding protein [Rubrobacter marinus]QIN79289.1 ATP-binding cassette domain-containing protein [Rubrobacter marinus]